MLSPLLTCSHREPGRHTSGIAVVPAGKTSVRVHLILPYSELVSRERSCEFSLEYSDDGKVWTELARATWQGPTPETPWLQVPVKYKERKFAPDLTGRLIHCLVKIPHLTEIGGDIEFV